MTVSIAPGETETAELGIDGVEIACTQIRYCWLTANADWVVLAEYAKKTRRELVQRGVCDATCGCCGGKTPDNDE